MVGQPAKKLLDSQSRNDWTANQGTIGQPTKGWLDRQPMNDLTANQGVICNQPNVNNNFRSRAIVIRTRTTADPLKKRMFLIAISAHLPQAQDPAAAHRDAGLANVADRVQSVFVGSTHTTYGNKPAKKQNKKTVRLRLSAWCVASVTQTHRHILAADRVGGRPSLCFYRDHAHRTM